MFRKSPRLCSRRWLTRLAIMVPTAALLAAFVSASPASALGGPPGIVPISLHVQSGMPATSSAPGGYCLDDYGNVQDPNGSLVDAYACNGTPAQSWIIFLNFDANSHLSLSFNLNYCLDVYKGGTANGTAVQLYPCTGRTNQDWNIEGNELVSVPSGKCLDIPKYSVTNPGQPPTQPPTQLVIWTCNGQWNQQWNVQQG
jgi:hypothetical protein